MYSLASIYIGLGTGEQVGPKVVRIASTFPTTNCSSNFLLSFALVTPFLGLTSNPLGIRLSASDCRCDW